MIDAREKMVKLAEFYTGVTELGGNNDGEIVRLFQRAVDGRASREPWCIAFLHHLKKTVEYTFGAKSRIFESESCLQTWFRSPAELRLTEPEIGAWMVWQYGETLKGHAEIVTAFGEPGLGIWTVGGNTTSGDGISREGDGVYRRYRRRDGNLQMKVLGYLRVFE